MDSDDKLIAIALTLFIGSGLLFTYLSDLHDQKMANIAAEIHQHEWELKVEYEQAKAEQARYRAAEVGYLCQFVDKEGVVYTEVDCESK